MIVLMMLGSQLGYYQNSLQAEWSGIGSLQDAGNGNARVLQNVLVNLLMFIPVITMALGGAFNEKLGKNPLFRLLLLIPMIIYGCSFYLDFLQATPFSEKFSDMYTALDHIIFIPFLLCFIMLIIYMFCAILRPESMATKAIGTITMIVGICFYVVFGIYVIYLQAMNALGGSFGLSHFILYLVCFALDVTTFFLMLSLIMSFCSMRREELLWAKERERRRRIDERRRSERETRQAFVYGEAGYYDIYDEDDDDNYGSYCEDEDEDESDAYVTNDGGKEVSAGIDKTPAPEKRGRPPKAT